MTERLCRNCGKLFVAAYWNSYYCEPVCRGGARRKRDRERKQYLGVPEKEFRGDGPNELKTPPVAKCRQCKRVRALRFDSYSDALDDKLDAEPIFCSADCVVEWWKARPGERPIVSLDIARLLGSWDANEAKAWHDYLHDDCDDDWDEYRIDANDLL